MSHFLYSLISFIVAIFFLLLGIVGIIIPWSSAVRAHFVQFILEDSLFIFLFGLGFVIIGAAIAINVILNAKKKYYEIHTGNNAAIVDESLFQDYLNTYWRQLFPKHEVPNQITLKKNKIHVAADLPYIPISEQKALLERIEKDLNDIFSRIFGYRNEFVITISFAEAEKAATPNKP